MRFTDLELASLEKKKKKNKNKNKKKKKKKKKKERKRRFSIFSKFIFLTSIKLSWNQRTYLYSGLSIDIHFIDLEVSYDVLSCTVKTFQPPSSLHRDHYRDI